MNKFYPEIHKNFGFGCMRLPVDSEENICEEEICRMFDMFLERGFNCFDTAHGYLSGQSEVAIRKCLTSRYPRDRYILTDKLSENFFEKEEDIRPLFQQQLDACGVDYFDFYLMHAQRAGNFQQYKNCHAYETAFALKKEGKIRHVGMSFHDTPEVLDQILTEYPQIEVVQLQFNYYDYYNESVQSRACYDVCVKHGKPVIVMEPVRGGSLVNIPDEAEEVLKNLNNGSNASFAIRFAAGHDNIMVVLSGMGSVEMVDDNTSYMQDFKPLSEQEKEAVFKVRDIINSKQMVSCTGCRYCTDGCPIGIRIPDVFALWNRSHMFKNVNAKDRYQRMISRSGNPADCLQCGQCEGICPQQLQIITLLQQAREELE